MLYSVLATALLALLLAAGEDAQAAEPPSVLRIVAPTSLAMPLLRMSGARPVDGLLKDVGELLARRLGLAAVFVPLPAKRAAAAIASGAVDLLCHEKAEWVDGPMLWTRPFLDSTRVVAAGAEAPLPASLRELQDERLGTVLGASYPAIERAFTRPMRREDVPDTEVNLRRLALGRVRYAVTDRAALAFFMRAHPDAGLREVWVVEHAQLGCALTLHKAGLLEPLNRAIDRIRADGSLDAVLNRYR